MSDKAVQFEVVFKVKAPTEQLITDYCITHLRDRGYSVTRPRATLETVSQFIARLGICYETLHRSLKRPGCPNVEINRGDSGRITSILSNAEFDQFCLRNKNPDQTSRL